MEEEAGKTEKTEEARRERRTRRTHDTTDTMTQGQTARFGHQEDKKHHREDGEEDGRDPGDDGSGGGAHPLIFPSELLSPAVRWEYRGCS